MAAKVRGRVAFGNLFMPTCVRRSLALGAVVVLAACGGSARPTDELQPEPARPFGSLAAQRVVVLPARYLRGDTIGWADQVGPSRDYLKTVDAEVAFALGERGLKTQWVFAEELARNAKRNPGYAADPYALTADFLRAGTRYDKPELVEPFATQVRSLTAIVDGARFALFPLEVRFQGTRDLARAILRVALVDTRSSRLMSAVEVASDPVSRLTPAVAATLALRLADLVAAP
ncbi:MAG: hypothetical protein NVS4B3_11470 [Gemmatimonadaceae bacterium]